MWGGCVSPSLSADAAHSEAKTRAAYRAELIEVAEVIAEALPGNPSRAAARPILAALAGAAMLFRAVQDEVPAGEIGNAVLRAVQPSQSMDR